MPTAAPDPAQPTPQAPVQQAAVDRCDLIAARAAAVPPGVWSWRGNADYPDSFRLDAPSYVTTDGKHQMSHSVLSLVRHVLTERDARVRCVGEYECENITGRPLLDADDVEVGETFGPGFDVLYEPEETYDQRRDETYGRAVAEVTAKAVTEWRTDEYGEPRIEHRLAFADERHFLVDAAQLAVYEVAPKATDPDDPKVYRRDIVGFRHPTAEFLSHARDDIAYLLAENARLRAQLACGHDEAGE